MNWVDDSHIWIEITSWDIWINWWWYCGRINQIFLISPKRAGPRKHQSKPVQSSFPSTFFRYFFPNQKNQQKPIGHWEPSRIFLSKASNENPRRREDQKTQVKAKKLQAKAEAEGARPMFLAEDIDQKTMEKEVDAKVEPQHFYFCCRARHFANFEGILEVLRKKRWNKGWCLPVSYCQRWALQRKTDHFSRRNGQATWLRRSPKRQQMRSMQKIWKWPAAKRPRPLMNVRSWERRRVVVERIWEEGVGGGILTTTKRFTKDTVDRYAGEIPECKKKTFCGPAKHSQGKCWHL